MESNLCCWWNLGQQEILGSDYVYCLSTLLTVVYVVCGGYEVVLLIWQGHEGKFSVYVHASQEKPMHESRYFINRDIRSDKVGNYKFELH